MSSDPLFLRSLSLVTVYRRIQRCGTGRLTGSLTGRVTDVGPHRRPARSVISNRLAANPAATHPLGNDVVAVQASEGMLRSCVSYCFVVEHHKARDTIGQGEAGGGRKTGAGCRANGSWPATHPTSGLACPIAAPSHADIRRLPCWIGSTGVENYPKGAMFLTSTFR